MMFQNETQKSVHFLNFSNHLLGHTPHLIHALCNVKRAAFRANCRHDASLVPSLIPLETALERIQAHSSENLLTLFPTDLLAGGGSIAIHMNISEVISSFSGVPIALINASQSTADVVHSAYRIAIYQSATEFLNTVQSTIETLSTQAEAWKPIATLSRTCLQDALSVSLGESWSAHAAALKRQSEAFKEQLKSLLKINIGGTVIGSGVGAPAAYRASVIQELATITDLPLTQRENLYDAAQNSDDLGMLHSSLSHLVQVLMKLSRDIRLLSSGPRGGFGELKLPSLQESSAFFGGSSLKVNPILPETLLQCGFLVLGGEHAIGMALQNAELNLNVFEGFIGATILHSLRSTTECLSKFHTHCLTKIEPHYERCHELSQFQSSLKSQHPSPADQHS